MEFPYGHHSHHHHHSRREEEEEEDERRRNYYPPPQGGPPPPPVVPAISPFDQPRPPPTSSYFGRGEEFPPPPPPLVQANPHVHHTSHSHAHVPPPQDFKYAEFPPPPPPPQQPPLHSFGHASTPTTVHHVAHHDLVGGQESETHHHIHRPNLPSFVHHHTHHSLPPELSNKPTVKVFSKAQPNFSLAIRDGKVILAPSDPSDVFQVNPFISFGLLRFSVCFSVVFCLADFFFLWLYYLVGFSTGTKMRSTVLGSRTKWAFPAFLSSTRPLVRLWSTPSGPPSL